MRLAVAHYSPPVETTQEPPEFSFETALAQLDQTIEAMEGGQVPLAELLTHFETGTRLLKLCSSRLKNAELKIEQLKQTAESEAPTLTAVALTQES